MVYHMENQQLEKTGHKKSRDCLQIWRSNEKESNTLFDKVTTDYQQRTFFSRSDTQLQNNL